MATRIIEYGGTGRLGLAYSVVPTDEYVTSQSAITPTSTSAQGAAFSAATGLVLVQCDEATYVKVANNPTATTNDYRIQAGQEQFFSVIPGAGWTAAVRT